MRAVARIGPAGSAIESQFISAASSALCEVTQIGKECHADCAIRRQAGDCVMPREGIFAVVLEEGQAHPGDLVEIVASE